MLDRKRCSMAQAKEHERNRKRRRESRYPRAARITYAVAQETFGGPGTGMERGKGETVKPLIRRKSVEEALSAAGEGDGQREERSSFIFPALRRTARTFFASSVGGGTASRCSVWTSADRAHSQPNSRASSSRERGLWRPFLGSFSSFRTMRSAMILAFTAGGISRLAFATASWP